MDASSSTSDTREEPAADPVDAAVRLLVETARDPDAAARIDAAALGRLLHAAIATYVRRVEQGEGLVALAPGSTAAIAGQASDYSLSATEVMVFVTQLLASAELELFELGMWQAWGGIGSPDGEVRG